MKTAAEQRLDDQLERTIAALQRMERLANAPRALQQRWGGFEKQNGGDTAST